MTKIKSISALQILDSRGIPTVQVFLKTDSGDIVSSCVPSGASTGSHEALELRDGGGDFCGKGVSKVIKNIEIEIAEPLIGRNPCMQEEIDKFLIDLDGTPDKSRLGANAILAVSLAVCKAAAKKRNLELYEHFDIKASILPIPLINMINGGAHADNNCGIQEFMIIPKGFQTFSLAMKASMEIFFNLKNILKARGLSTNVGDEGGFAPNLKSNEEAIELLLYAIKTSGYTEGKEIFIGLDIAANELVKGEGFAFLKDQKEIVSREKIISRYKEWIAKYPIISIEDPMPEDDWAGWKTLTEKIQNCQIVGDDLFVTQENRLQKGIDENSANAILIKPNQVGTITETLSTISLAQKNKFATIISHRSGDTEDTFISDLAVGTSAKQIKTGSLSRSERTAKYNRLIKIEKELGGKAIYAGCI